MAFSGAMDHKARRGGKDRKEHRARSLASKGRRACPEKQGRRGTKGQSERRQPYRGRRVLMVRPGRRVARETRARKDSVDTRETPAYRGTKGSRALKG